MDYQSSPWQIAKIATKKKEAKKKILLIMEHISKQLKQQIIDSANIVDVVGSFVELKRKSTNYTGICPFHDDHHSGNLIVSPSKNIATCFACGDGSMDSVGFLMRMGMTFYEALVWIARQNNIPVKGTMNMETPTIVKKDKPKTEPLYLPLKMAEDRVGNYELNPLVTWIKHLPWHSVLQKASVDYWLKEYYVGTSIGTSTYGWVIWWQIDALNRPLTGKVMKYKADGHRDKDSTYHIDTIPQMLKKAGQLNLIGKELQSCLFGLHLVFKYDYKTVCIVESEKSAIIAQIYNPDTERVFVATGGKSYLTDKTIKPLVQKGCNIILYPDVDAIKEWSAFAKKCDYGKICVAKSMAQLYDPSKDSDHADIADILIRRLEEKRDEVFMSDKKAEDAEV